VLVTQVRKEQVIDTFYYFDAYDFLSKVGGYLFFLIPLFLLIDPIFKTSFMFDFARLIKQRQIEAYRADLIETA